MKKKIIKLVLLLGIIFITGCGNNKGIEVYKKFEERYSVEFIDTSEIDKYPLSIYKKSGAYYVKLLNENYRPRYYLWNMGSSINKGLSVLTEEKFTVDVGNSEPIYEQNMK